MPKIKSFLSEEERRLKIRILEMGIRQCDIAKAIGIADSDVTKVIRGRSQSPGYIAKVYAYLGLEIPKK